MIIRKAEIKDIEELLAIYNYEVVNGTATFDTRERTLDEWKEWFSLHNVGNHPLIVCEDNGKVLGYASLSRYREKDAYDATVELSVYVAPQSRGMGIGTRLMNEILDMAKKDESIHCVVSVITGGNEKSVRLHEKLGFTYSGTIHECGVKFGEYVSIVNYEMLV